jgi:hypothetical protein
MTNLHLMTLKSSELSQKKKTIVVTEVVIDPYFVYLKYAIPALAIAQGSGGTEDALMADTSSKRPRMMDIVNVPMDENFL